MATAKLVIQANGQQAVQELGRVNNALRGTSSASRSVGVATTGMSRDTNKAMMMMGGSTTAMFLKFGLLSAAVGFVKNAISGVTQEGEKAAAEFQQFDTATRTIGATMGISGRALKRFQADIQAMAAELSIPQEELVKMTEKIMDMVDVGSKDLPKLTAEFAKVGTVGKPEDLAKVMSTLKERKEKMGIDVKPGEMTAAISALRQAEQLEGRAEVRAKKDVLRRLKKGQLVGGYEAQQDIDESFKIFRDSESARRRIVKEIQPMKERWESPNLRKMGDVTSEMSVAGITGTLARGRLPGQTGREIWWGNDYAEHRTVQKFAGASYLGAKNQTPHNSARSR